jgi:hypothetical protein
MKIKEIFLTLLFICGVILAVMFYNEKTKPDPTLFWQLEYAKAKIRSDRYNHEIDLLLDSVGTLNVKISNNKPKIIEKKVFVQALKDSLTQTTDTATIVAIQGNIIAIQDTTIQLYEESLTDCLKMVEVQSVVIVKKDSIIADNNRLIEIANKNATPTFYQRNKFWFGVGAGVAVVVGGLFLAK